MSETSKKQNFLQGAALLAIATAIVKLIGAFYKLPLNMAIGAEGYSYFTTAYDIYTVLLVVSTTGLPVAMSRMVSEAHALGNGKQMQRIFKTALIAYLTIGLLGTGAMILSNKLHLFYAIVLLCGGLYGLYTLFQYTWFPAEEESEWEDAEESPYVPADNPENPNAE